MLGLYIEEIKIGEVEREAKMKLAIRRPVGREHAPRSGQGGLLMGSEVENAY